MFVGVTVPTRDLLSRSCMQTGSEPGIALDPTILVIAVACGAPATAAFARCVEIPCEHHHLVQTHVATTKRGVWKEICSQQLNHLRHVAHRIKPYLGFGVPIGSAYLSARRTFPIGWPKVRFNPSAPPCFGRKKLPEVRPDLRPAESTAVPSAGPVGRPKVRFNPSPPLVVIPPYTNTPPPPVY